MSYFHLASPVRQDENIIYFVAMYSFSRRFPNMLNIIVR